MVNKMNLDTFTQMIISKLNPAPKDLMFDGMTFDYAIKNANEVIQMSMLYLEAIGYSIYYNEYAKVFLIQSPIVH